MAIARLNNTRITPRKARIIANLIREQRVTAAINNLRFLHKAGAKQFFKLLVSAVANAEDKGDVNVDNLVISKVFGRSGADAQALASPGHGSRQSNFEEDQPHHARSGGGTQLMGQKTHPIGFRIGVVRTWSSKWFENARYRQWLHEDILLRRFLKKELYAASIADITMERAANKLKINIFSARPRNHHRQARCRR